MLGTRQWSSMSVCTALSDLPCLRCTVVATAGQMGNWLRVHLHMLTLLRYSALGVHVCAAAWPTLSGWYMCRWVLRSCLGFRVLGCRTRFTRRQSRCRLCARRGTCRVCRWPACPPGQDWCRRARLARPRKARRCDKGRHTRACFSEARSPTWGTMVTWCPRL